MGGNSFWATDAHAGGLEVVRAGTALDIGIVAIGFDGDKRNTKKQQQKGRHRGASGLLCAAGNQLRSGRGDGEREREREGGRGRGEGERERGGE